MAVATPDVVAAARELVPALRERRIETDALRRLPDATVGEIVRLRLPGIVVPPERGGDGLGVDTLFDVIVELGAGCGATAWTAGNWAIHGVLMAMFPVQAQDEAFPADGPMPIVSTGFSPARGRTVPTEGGQLLDGQWDFASGVDHADWVVVVGVGETGPLAHLVPKADLEVIDTWHTVGLRGTGSNDVRATSVFVPAHRILPLQDAVSGAHVGRELYDDPYLRLPLTSLFHVGIIGAIVGMAHGAVDHFVQTTSAKVGGLSGIAVNARPEVHQRIGEASAEVNAAHTVVRKTFAEMRETGSSGQEPTILQRAGWRRDAAWASKTCVAAVGRLYDVGGAHSLWADDQLQQFWRDVNAAAHHYGVQYDGLFIGYGRAALGQDPGVPML